MKATTYRIVPLPTEVAEHARANARAGASDHVIVTADAAKSYPCRHCLQWAAPGEELVLFPFTTIGPGKPYAETGPIFVHAGACERYRATDEFPGEFREGRSIRGYDAAENMIAGEVINGSGPEEVIDRLLENPQIAFLQVRSASRGCYTFGIERA
ncbi:MAG TPA: DUF1203 domain-containing protein [Chthoniobacterales bacterium]